MNFLEKDLEILIFEASKTLDGREQLRKRGLDFIFNPLHRQVDLGAYGILDLLQVQYETFGKQPKISIDVIELKKDEINVETFLQAIRYCTGIREYIKSRYDDADISFNIHLIGKVLETKSNFCFLTDWIDYQGFDLIFYEYKASLEVGFYFETKSGYHAKGRNDGKMELFLDLIESYQKETISKYVDELNKLFDIFNLDEKRKKYSIGIYLASIQCKDIDTICFTTDVITEIAETVLVTTDEDLDRVMVELIDQYTNAKLPF